MHEISVVIPAYKAASTIERSVRSALAQPNVQVEVIVVVDGACSDTEAVLSAMASPQLTVLVNEVNAGAQISRNRGLAAANHPFVMFLDSDDFIMGDLLQGMAEAIVAQACDIAFGPWIWLDEKAGRCVRVQRRFSDRSDLFYRWLVERHYAPPCSVLWRTAHLRQIGGWDQSVRRFQDIELVLRAVTLGARFASSNEGAGVYYQHPAEHRLTGGGRNFDSVIAVCEKLVALSGDAVPLAVRQDAVARYLYELGCNLVRSGQGDLGRTTLARSRTLGFRGHRGTRSARLGSRLLGVERYQKLAQSLKPRQF